MRDDMRDWVLENERMARVLAARGYDYQCVFARDAGHTDRGVKQQTLPEALEWVWKALARGRDFAAPTETTSSRARS